MRSIVAEGDLLCPRCGASLGRVHPVEEGALVEAEMAVARLNNALAVVPANS